MLRLRALLVPLLVLALCAAAGVWYSRSFQAAVRADFESYLAEVTRVEREFLDNLPVYADWTSPAREKELRRFLLKRHLALAAASGLPLVRDDTELAAGLRAGRLREIERGPESLFYFYNVPKKYRVLSPATQAGLAAITRRFAENLRKRGATADVKIALSSVIRPVDYQRALQQRNANAAGASSHSYGVSFDLFYDDFYVVLPPPAGTNALSQALLEKLRPRLGYLLGDALARQFRSVLAESLIELQNEGRLYAILERRQRCYHVSILPPGYDGSEQDEKRKRK